MIHNIYKYIHIYSALLINVVFMWFYCTPGAVSDGEATDDAGEGESKYRLTLICDLPGI